MQLRGPKSKKRKHKYDLKKEKDKKEKEKLKNTHRRISERFVERRKLHP